MNDKVQYIFYVTAFLVVCKWITKLIMKVYDEYMYRSGMFREGIDRLYQKILFITTWGLLVTIGIIIAMIFFKG